MNLEYNEFDRNSFGYSTQKCPENFKCLETGKYLVFPIYSSNRYFF